MPSRYYSVSEPNPIRRRWIKLLVRLGRWQPSPTPPSVVSSSHPSFEIALSPLDRVIAVGQAAEAAGIRVELIAIEIRRAGALLSWRATPVGELMLLSADVLVSDDRGTTYQSMPADHEGSAVHWSGHSVVMPPPPRNARLTIELRSFGPRAGDPVRRGLDAQRAVGPWPFTVTV